MDMAQRFQQLRAFDGNLHCNTRPIPEMEKPGRPERRAAAIETRKADPCWIGSNPRGDGKVARMTLKRKG
jgi:hypothetical protein